MPWPTKADVELIRAALWIAIDCETDTMQSYELNGKVLPAWGESYREAKVRRSRFVKTLARLDKAMKGVR